jgi:LysM repeat protein
MNYLRGIISIFLLTVILSSGIFPVKAAAEDTDLVNKSGVHVVKRGETVYSISRTYGVTAEELMKHNNITDASKLQVGKQLRIPPSAFYPAGNSVTATQPGGEIRPLAEYRVVKGDTLFNIARTHGISLQSLLDLNSFSSNYVIKEGERIKVPAPAASATVQTAVRPVQPVENEPRQTSPRSVDSSLRWPVSAKEIAYMTGKLYGVVVQGERFEPVKSLTQGTVISAGPYRGFGRVAIVQVSGGYLYVYGGCESLSVKEGDRIGPGTELGKLGIDAVSEKPQLFFMVYRSNTPIDPAKAPRA